MLHSNFHDGHRDLEVVAVALIVKLRTQGDVGALFNDLKPKFTVCLKGFLDLLSIPPS